MKIKEKTIRQIVRSLCHAMDIGTIQNMVRSIIPDYSYHESLGITESVSITAQDAARKIITDIRDRNLFPDFVVAMIKAQKGSLFGKKYHFIHMPDILSELNEFGLLYDSSSEMFMENPEVRRTRNWSVLQEDHEYLVTLMRLDLAGNSKIVRKYDSSKIKHAYTALREITKEVVEYRNGRIWRWDGDGGIAAFHFRKRIENAVLSSMEILHRMFLFNHFLNKLPVNLKVRIAVDTGHMAYTSNEEKLMQCETVKKAIDLEANHTSPDSITIGSDSLTCLKQNLVHKFKETKTHSTRKLYSYKIEWRDE